MHPNVFDAAEPIMFWLSISIDLNRYHPLVLVLSATSEQIKLPSRGVKMLDIEGGKNSLFDRAAEIMSSKYACVCCIALFTKVS